MHCHFLFVRQSNWTHLFAYKHYIYSLRILFLLSIFFSCLFVYFHFFFRKYCFRPGRAWSKKRSKNKNKSGYYLKAIHLHTKSNLYTLSKVKERDFYFFSLFTPLKNSQRRLHYRPCLWLFWEIEFYIICACIKTLSE